MKIILISGKAGSGKDTVANLIHEYLDEKHKSVLVIHFGDVVKYFASQYYDWDGQKNTQGRELLQSIGTTKLRTYFPTYWAEIVAKFLSAITHTKDFDYALIPDLRFINEFETICEYNEDVIAIRVNRLDDQNRYVYNPHMTIKQLTHISECELDNFPFEWIIENRGTIDDLKDSVEYILDELTGETHDELV